jgi:hypothetical protein
VTPEEHIALLVHFLEREVVRLPCLQPKKVGTIGADHLTAAVAVGCRHCVCTPSLDRDCG